MGSYINLTNHIEISTKTKADGYFRTIGYSDIDDELIQQITETRKVRWIQICTALPDKAFPMIDRILEARPDITFRMYSFSDCKTIDISFLKRMPHMQRLQIDCIDFRHNPDRIDFSLLHDLPLKALHIWCFNLRDYRFIQNLSEELEELTVVAETLGGSVRFDCEWLVKFPKLHTLFLGKKARKNIESLRQLPQLKSLSLRGIKLTDFTFLKQMNLEKLALLWNSNNDLHDLADLTGLREIELWRINLLDDISFIRNLRQLEVIKLQDLRHIRKLPDLSEHKNLQHIYLTDTGIDESLMPKELRALVSHWDTRLL
ncbi:MAG: hypothetical protein HUJ58_05985 [Erysipelotrichaceae bacterium]|nr:hypothetical protein [Erysipelotrichaceae bacterium]